MRVSLLVVKARRDRVAALLRQQRYLPLNDLCARFGISEATARRDLVALAREQKIQRTYGGALRDFNLPFTSVLERSQQAPEAKSQIATAALPHLRPGQVYYLDAGSTVYAIAEALVRQPITPLTVVTNNLLVTECLSGSDGIQVHLLGGQLLPRQSVLLGKKALAALRFWKFHAAFLSAEGCNARGIWNSRSDVVEFQLGVFQRAKNSFFCLDRTKINRPAPHLLVLWKQVRHFLTDATASDLQAARIPLRVLA